MTSATKEKPVRLARTASNEAALPAIRLVQSSRFARRVAKVVLILLVISLFAVLFAPWQQTITGSGRVVAYAPLQRQQTVESPISGRIDSWGDEIQEGAFVKKGQTVLEIRDLDPNLQERLAEQLAATERELESNKAIAEAYAGQMEAFQTVLEQTVAAANEYVRMTEDKITAAERGLDAERAAEEQERTNLTRQKKLFEDGLASKLTYQVAERKYKEAVAKVKQAESYVSAARSELAAKKNERSAKEREARTKIDSATAAWRKAQGDVAKTEKELAVLKTKIAQQKSQQVTAPRDGYILKLMANQGGEIVKQGDPLFVLVPDTKDRAVEVWLAGNDAPLVSPGRHVRLQFEGWPAVQFTGWPSVAVGSFGGVVKTVDSTDDGKGNFRVVILPDAADEAWPSDRFLRQGVRANAWILLDEVGLGYELWRRMNGFPPVVDVNEPKTGSKGK